MGRVKRRLISTTAVGAVAVALTLALPLWLPLAVAVDLVRGRRRCPVARLLAFAWGWSWLETAGVAAASWLWLTGRRRDQRAHYRLQRWWATDLMRVLRASTGLTVEVHGVEHLRPGPPIVLCRHASLADSLVSAWVITSLADQHPRYVLKRELLADPCLDVVGSRLPNHFLDRDATDSEAELGALRALSTGLGTDDVAVIFPEGTRAAPAKRARAIARIADRDPARAARLSPLRHLLPPRPAGTSALLDGAPDADVVIAWHTGFEGLDTFGGIVRALGRGAPRVHFAARRVPRNDVPLTSDPASFTAWLDTVWLAADDAVHELLQGDVGRATPSTTASDARPIG